MIVFGSPVGEPEAYRRYAGPAIRRVAEADSVVDAFAAAGPIARTYNLLLDHAARHDDLEAAVLVHPHAEITDPAFCAKVRAALADPAVGIVGCAGASGARSLAWWQGDVVTGPVLHRYGAHGGGDFPLYGWADPRPAPAEVEVADGWLLAFSPRAARELRFDEALHPSLGYDVELCLRARDAGFKVVVADLAATFHRSFELAADPELFAEGHLAVAARVEADGGDEAAWKARARHAEAERELARIQAGFRQVAAQERIDRLEAAFAAATATPGWKLTAPLRRANHWRRSRG